MRAIPALLWLLPAVALASSPPAAEPAFTTDLPIDDTLTPEQAMGVQLATDADSALVLAQQQLDAGKVEDVVATLEGRALPESRKPKASALLAKAAALALERDDAAMALLAAQLSLRQQKDSTAALSILTRVCRSSEEFSAAERYADRWLALEPKSPEARLVRAELAFDQGEWQRTLDLLKPLANARLDVTQVERRDGLVEKSKQELEAIEKGTAVQRSVEKKVRALRENQPPPPPPRRDNAPAPAPEPRVRTFERGNAEVVMFSTPWCGGFCKKAREWLKNKGIRYAERDIETDPSAAEAMQSLAKSSGVQAGGVPAFDVKGRLLQGFDPAAIDAALH